MAHQRIDFANTTYDLTSQVTVLNDTPSASFNTLCIGWIEVGNGLNNLDGSGGDFELEVVVNNQTVQPVQSIPFTTAVRSGIVTNQFIVPANKSVQFKLTSPNPADTNVNVKAEIYNVQPLGLPNYTVNSAGGIPVSAAGRTAGDLDDALDAMLEWQDGERLDLLLDAAAAGGGGGSTVNITTEETNIVSENS